jgi:hypothetical protein
MSLIGRIIQGIGAGLMQTAALGEATAQNKEDEGKIVGYIEFSEEFGCFVSLYFDAFFGHLFGFIGPFALFGSVFLIFTIFQSKLIDFMPNSSDKVVLNIEKIKTS